MEEIVWPTIYWLKENRPPPYYPVHDRFLHEVKIFTVAGLAAEPFRVENWQGMLWGRNLYKQEGRWTLTIPAEEFKNRRLLERPYRAVVERAAQEFFEAYYRVWIEAFGYDPLSKEHRNIRSYVHAAWRAGPPSRKSCHSIVRGRLLFLSTVWDITVGPQAFRHIWATDWLKRFPLDYGTVAGKLNDRVSTVLRNYGHLNAADHAARADKANTGVPERAIANLRSHLESRKRV